MPDQFQYGYQTAAAKFLQGIVMNANDHIYRVYTAQYWFRLVKVHELSQLWKWHQADFGLHNVTESGNIRRKRVLCLLALMEIFFLRRRAAVALTLVILSMKGKACRIKSRHVNRLAST